MTKHAQHMVHAQTIDAVRRPDGPGPTIGAAMSKSKEICVKPHACRRLGPAIRIGGVFRRQVSYRANPPLAEDIPNAA
ncbi:hypothetical protein JANAI61_36700 [Jannaschia sp. AI_61]|nr:hypothetical protein JANAI61_36700 [Jannaschia sp. AI_61]